MATEDPQSSLYRYMNASVRNGPVALGNKPKPDSVF